VAREEQRVELARVLAQELEVVQHGVELARQAAAGLSERDLGDEQPEDEAGSQGFWMR
jgi:hypothetical protein